MAANFWLQFRAFWKLALRLARSASFSANHSAPWTWSFLITLRAIHTRVHWLVVLYLLESSQFWGYEKRTFVSHLPKIETDIAHLDCWVINWNSVNTFLSTFGSSQLKMTVPNTQILQYLDGLLTQGKKDDVMNYLKSLPDDERKGNPKRPACCQIHKYCFFCIVFANFINFRITKTFGCLQRTKRSWDVLPRFRRRCIPTKLISLKK